MLFIVYDEAEKSLVGYIYEEHSKRMLKVGQKFLSENEAQDALHDIIERFAKKTQKELQELSDKPPHYFVITMKNQCIDILRKKAREKEVVDFVQDDNIFINNSTNPQVDVPDDKEALAELIRLLKPTFREVIEYRYYLGYSNMEIAEMLSISESLVATRLDRARRKLKTIIEQRGGAINGLHR